MKLFERVRKTGWLFWRDQHEESTSVRKLSSILVVAGVVLASVTVGTVSGLASLFARTVVTPSREREDNLPILAVEEHTNTHPARMEVTLPANPQTTVPGTYSLSFNQAEGLARIGRITSYGPSHATVNREVEQIYRGDLFAASWGRWTGTIYPTPQFMGVSYEDIDIKVEAGLAPAWLITPPASCSKDGVSRGNYHQNRRAWEKNRWAIMVHGRGAQRDEGLKAIRTAQDLGMTSLLISYRNDGEAPNADDSRYGLGTTEWHDVESAIKYALEHGADEVVLFGWSMGASVCLQLVDRSIYSNKVAALVLSGPVVNWIDVLQHQAKLNRLPQAVGTLGQWLLSSPSGRWITGLAAPLDLKALDWVSRADQLAVPTLILHSADDDFVPIGPSLQLAHKNPRLVTLIRFAQAGHTREYNVDPQRWDTAVRLWLTSMMKLPKPGVAELESALKTPSRQDMLISSSLRRSRG